MERKAREIHSLAEHAREDGNFLDALKFTDEATVQYAQENDLLGLAEVQGSRFLTLRHLAESTNQPAYMLLAKHAAMAAAEIADMSNDPSAIALPYFNLGKAHESLVELPDAIGAYKKAIAAQEATPDSHHARPAVLNDMKVHLAVCELKNSDEGALDRAIEALKALEEDPDEGAYTRDVWVSGGHMKLAQVLSHLNMEKAKEHLAIAKKIIDSNPELVLRKAQWDALAATFE